MRISVREAVETGMTAEQLDREYEIEQSEEWVPEDQYWESMVNQPPKEFSRTLHRVLTNWALNEYSNRYKYD